MSQSQLGRGQLLWWSYTTHASTCMSDSPSRHLQTESGLQKWPRVTTLYTQRVGANTAAGVPFIENRSQQCEWWSASQGKPFFPHAPCKEAHTGFKHHSCDRDSLRLVNKKGSKKNKPKNLYLGELKQWQGTIWFVTQTHIDKPQTFPVMQRRGEQELHLWITAPTFKKNNHLNRKCNDINFLSHR